MTISKLDTKRLEFDFPAMIPKFNDSRLGPKPNRSLFGGYDRFVSTLAGISLDTVNAFVNYKRSQLYRKV